MGEGDIQGTDNSMMQTGQGNFIDPQLSLWQFFGMQNMLQQMGLGRTPIVDPWGGSVANNPFAFMQDPFAGRKQSAFTNPGQFFGQSLLNQITGQTYTPWRTPDYGYQVQFGTTPFQASRAFQNYSEYQGMGGFITPGADTSSQTYNMLSNMANAANLGDLPYAQTMAMLNNPALKPMIGNMMQYMGMPSSDAFKYNLFANRVSGMGGDVMSAIPKTSSFSWRPPPANMSTIAQGEDTTSLATEVAGSVYEEAMRAIHAGYGTRDSNGNMRDVNALRLTDTVRRTGLSTSQAYNLVEIAQRGGYYGNDPEAIRRGGTKMTEDLFSSFSDVGSAVGGPDQAMKALAYTTGGTAFQNPEKLKQVSASIKNFGESLQAIGMAQDEIGKVIESWSTKEMSSGKYAMSPAGRPMMGDGFAARLSNIGEGAKQLYALNFAPGAEKLPFELTPQAAAAMSGMKETMIDDSQLSGFTQAYRLAEQRGMVPDSLKKLYNSALASGNPRDMMPVMNALSGAFGMNQAEFGQSLNDPRSQLRQMLNRDLESAGSGRARLDTKRMVASTFELEKTDMLENSLAGAMENTPGSELFLGNGERLDKAYVGGVISSIKAADMDPSKKKALLQGLEGLDTNEAVSQIDSVSGYAGFRLGGAKARISSRTDIMMKAGSVKQGLALYGMSNNIRDNAIRTRIQEMGANEDYRGLQKMAETWGATSIYADDISEGVARFDVNARQFEEQDAVANANVGKVFDLAGNTAAGARLSGMIKASSDPKKAQEMTEKLTRYFTDAQGKPRPMTNVWEKVGALTMGAQGGFGDKVQDMVYQSVYGDDLAAKIKIADAGIKSAGDDSVKIDAANTARAEVLREANARLFEDMAASKMASDPTKTMTKEAAMKSIQGEYGLDKAGNLVSKTPEAKDQPAGPMEQLATWVGDIARGMKEIIAAVQSIPAKAQQDNSKGTTQTPAANQGTITLNATGSKDSGSTGTYAAASTTTGK